MGRKKVLEYCKDLEENIEDVLDALQDAMLSIKENPLECDLTEFSILVTTLLVQIAQTSTIKQTIEEVDKGEDCQH